MSDTGPLLLGPVLFEDFETPATVGFGGSQRLAMHHLPGGARVIDAMGRDDADIAWSGIFTGVDAALRARAVDQFRAAGLPLPLTWDTFFYTVLLSRFEADYTRSNWIPYRIVCTVIRDEAAGPVETALSLGVAAIADLASATGFATGLDLSSPLAALGQPGAATRGTAAYGAATAATAAARQQIEAGIARASGALAAAPVASAAGLASAADQSGTLAALTAARGYVQRAGANLLDAST